MAKLADEIKSKAFSHPEEEAMLNIFRTADVLSQRMGEFLKPFDISGPQYNVLRILRGSTGGRSCGQIADRMISRDPDVTRLLDRLEARGLIMRGRNEQDRRVVVAHITPEGLNLMSSIDPLIVAEHVRQLGALGHQKLRQLIELLEQVRESAELEKERHESDLPD
jgi:MarR family transcriptional regulator, organic hydroperoxide resistance regulator